MSRMAGSPSSSLGLGGIGPAPSTVTPVRPGLEDVVELGLADQHEVSPTEPSRPR